MARPYAMRKGKTGCVTCRIRKIKCDEAKPSCQKCISTGRKCDGYLTLPFSGRDLEAASQNAQELSMSISKKSTGLIPRLLSNASFSNVAEKRYFQFFRDCTVVSTNLTVHSRFWDRLVLQACDAEPAIKHAVLTLAAFHNSILPNNDTGAAQQHLIYADRQHQLALGHTKQLLSKTSSKQVDLVLIVCALFVLYEGLRGNFSASQAHMISGRTIAARNRETNPGAIRRGHLSEIAEMFARLDVFALSFSDDAAPYRYTFEDLLWTAPRHSLSIFNNIDEAQATLIDLLRWILMLGNDEYEKRSEGLSSDVHFEPLLEDCRHRLSLWRQHWDDLLQVDRGIASTLHAKFIELWYITTLTMFDTGFIGLETIYDSMQDYFVRMIELSECISSELSKQPNMASFSLDLGFLMPNFFCAVRCRDPKLRRRAVRMLELHPRQEGIWEGRAAGAIANRWVQIEEEASGGNIERAEQIPEFNRIASLNPQIDIQSSSARLRFTFNVTSGRDNASVDENLKWES